MLSCSSVQGVYKTNQALKHLFQKSSSVSREHSLRISYSLVTQAHTTPYIYTQIQNTFTPFIHTTHICKYTPQINHIHIYKSHEYTRHRNAMHVTHRAHKIHACTDIQYINTCSRGFHWDHWLPNK